MMRVKNKQLQLQFINENLNGINFPIKWKALGLAVNVQAFCSKNVTAVGSIPAVYSMW